MVGAVVAHASQKHPVKVQSVYTGLPADLFFNNLSFWENSLSHKVLVKSQFFKAC